MYIKRSFSLLLFIHKSLIKYDVLLERYYLFIAITQLLIVFDIIRSVLSLPDIRFPVYTTTITTVL